MQLYIFSLYCLQSQFRLSIPLSIASLCLIRCSQQLSIFDHYLPTSLYTVCCPLFLLSHNIFLINVEPVVVILFDNLLCVIWSIDLFVQVILSTLFHPLL